MRWERGAFFHLARAGGGGVMEHRWKPAAEKRLQHVQDASGQVREWRAGAGGGGSPSVVTSLSGPRKSSMLRAREEVMEIAAAESGRMMSLLGGRGTVFLKAWGHA